MMYKKSGLFLILLLALFSFIFFECKTDQTSNETTDQATEVRVRFQTALTSLNPYLYRMNLEANVFDLMYQYPLQFDLSTLKLSPQLAKAMPTVEEITEGDYAGGRSFSFEFFEEAVWDDGTPITGHDYEFTMKAIFNPQMKTQRFAAWIDYIREVRVDEANPKKFTVITARPYLVDVEALSNYIILPKHLYDPNGLMDDFELKDLTNPEKAAALKDSDERLAQFAEAYEDPKLSREVFHGSGPYKFVEWVDGQVITLERKENWWGDKVGAEYPMLEAYPDKFEFKPIEDNAAAAVALQDGQIDVMSEVDSKQFLEARNNEYLKENFNFFTPTRMAFFYTAMNNDNPKLADKKVRRAIAHCYDMDEIIKTAYEGFGEAVPGPFLPDKSYFHDGLEIIKKDLDKAKALLAEAGWTDSNNNGVVDKMIDGELTELSIDFLYTPTVPFQDVQTTLVSENAKQVGIEIKRVAMDSKQLGQRLRQRDYEMAGRGAGSNPVPDDPKQYWHCDSARPGGSNYVNFCNKDADALIDEIRVTTDIVRRDEAYRQLQEIIYDEQPMVFLFSPKQKIIVNNRFKDPVISKFKLGISLQHLHQ